MTKSTKSQQGGLTPSSFRTSCGVHELVARAMRGKCVRHRIKQKSAVLPLSAILTIPRVRTYHTRKPSRFVHALSARPLRKVWRGRESNMYADGMESVFFCFFIGYAWTLVCSGRCRRDRDRRLAAVGGLTKRL